MNAVRRLVVGLAITLVACGAPTPEEGQHFADAHLVYAEVQGDGRVIPCVIYRYEAVSCDWSGR